MAMRRSLSGKKGVSPGSIKKARMEFHPGLWLGLKKARYCSRPLPSRHWFKRSI